MRSSSSFLSHLHSTRSSNSLFYHAFGSDQPANTFCTGNFLTDHVVDGQCDANSVSVHVTMTNVVRHYRNHNHDRHNRGSGRVPIVMMVHVFLFAAFVASLPVALASSASSSLPPSGNGLWDDLVGKCDGPRNTMDCVRSRLYNYVDHTFESDFNITDGLTFTKNQNNYDSMCSNTNGSHREAREMVSSANL